jgi:hypothetical protein
MKVLLLLAVAYSILFGADYKKAVQFNITNHKEFQKVAHENSMDVALLKAIVFPELIRYSMFKDFLETKALEILYVNEATSVDFSIGAFQMKPSFAEEVESYLKNYTVCGFEELTNYRGLEKKERIERLKSLQWQLKYLAAFVKIMDYTFSHICFSNIEEKLRFYASAYNCGFNHPFTYIQQKSKENNFPYGARVNTPQHNYAEVSVNYYLIILKKEAL